MKEDEYMVDNREGDSSRVDDAEDKMRKADDAPHVDEAHAEDGKTHKSVSLIKILGGDILTHDFFRRQILLLVMLVVYAIIYISNRYVCQQQLIEIDVLKKQLTDIKYDALTRSSELTEKSRQSKIEEYVSTREDSQLETSTNPPYLIK